MLRFSRWLSRAGIRCATCSRSRNAWSGSRASKRPDGRRRSISTRPRTHFIVTAELPGLSREDIDIRFHDGQLTLQGTRRKPDVPCERYHRVERGHGAFIAASRCPAPVDADGITAELRDGVLTVTVPKTAGSAPRRIDVS